MPNYPWLQKTALDTSDIQDRMIALKRVGVPYSQTTTEYEANVKKFGEAVAKTLDINTAEANLLAQAQAGNYDGNPANVSEMDALVAYLQVLGTMVDFSKFDEDHFIQFR
jgi:cytochrome c oxidase cbb3-type subunit 2